MWTRRNFVLNLLGGLAASTAGVNWGLGAGGSLAWPGPIGLQLGWLREVFAVNPEEAHRQLLASGGRGIPKYNPDPRDALRQIAAIGYRDVELAPNNGLAPSVADLRAAGLAAVGAYFTLPKSLEDWKQAIEQAKRHELHYMTVGTNPKLDPAGSERFIDFMGRCGDLCHAAEIQFCYHAHNREFVSFDGTTAYDRMLSRLDPNTLQMEMDVYGVVCAGVDPVSYFRRYPGRFPLLHLKDLRKGVTIRSQGNPPPEGPKDPVVPIGQGQIDYARILGHAGEAGTRHIYVELNDRGGISVLEAARISFDYLKHLRLS
jgi:sugar phosphate isomerase/epimerase